MTGEKNPGKEQVIKIQKAVREIGKELSTIELTN